jgi:hypothetical protein
MTRATRRTQEVLLVTRPKSLYVGLLDLFVNPVPRLGARGPEHRHAIALVPPGTQAGQVVDRRPKSKERVDEDASDGFFVARLTVVGVCDGVVLIGMATDQTT